jgi:hypothetical protein
LFLVVAASCSWGIEFLSGEGPGDGDGDHHPGGAPGTGGSFGSGGENLAGSSNGGHAPCDSGEATEWFEDADGDGAGDASSSVFACAAPPGYVEDNTDCAVLDGPDPDCNGQHGSVCSSMHEGLDLCDGADNDCDGDVDEDCSQLPVTAGLLLWLDADDDTTYDVSSPIGQWRDKSGANRHAVQLESAKRPEQVTSVQAGLSVLRFDGTDDSLIVDNSSGVFDAVNLTVMYVVAPKWTVPPSGNPSPLAIRGTHSGQTRFSTHLNGDLTSFMGFDGVQNLSSEVTFLPDEFRFFEFSVVGENNSSHYLDGVLRSSFGHGLRETELLRPVRLAAAQDDLEHFEGDIAEVIIYGRTLLVSERDQLEAYIEAKWGIEM